MKKSRISDSQIIEALKRGHDDPACASFGDKTGKTKKTHRITGKT